MSLHNQHLDKQQAACRHSHAPDQPCWARRQLLGPACPASALPGQAAGLQGHHSQGPGARLPGRAPAGNRQPQGQHQPLQQRVQRGDLHAPCPAGACACVRLPMCNALCSYLIHGKRKTWCTGARTQQDTLHTAAALLQSIVARADGSSSGFACTGAWLMCLWGAGHATRRGHDIWVASHERRPSHTPAASAGGPPAAAAAHQVRRCSCASNAVPITWPLLTCQQQAPSARPLRIPRAGGAALQSVHDQMQADHERWASWPPLCLPALQLAFAAACCTH